MPPEKNPLRITKHRGRQTIPLEFVVLVDCAGTLIGGMLGWFIAPVLMGDVTDRGFTMIIRVVGTVPVGAMIGLILTAIIRQVIEEKWAKQFREEREATFRHFNEDHPSAGETGTMPSHDRRIHSPRTGEAK